MVFFFVNAFFVPCKFHPFESELPHLTISQDRTWLLSRARRPRSQGQKLVGGFNTCFSPFRANALHSFTMFYHGSTSINDDGWFDFPIFVLARFGLIWLLLITVGYIWLLLVSILCPFFLWFIAPFRGSQDENNASSGPSRGARPGEWQHPISWMMWKKWRPTFIIILPKSCHFWV